ncbi:MAG TPA: glycogen debranching enzyme GlgX, partial [Methylomirabilota bacterium]
EANGEDNRDGNSNNLSFNHGAEGPTTDAAIRAVRERQKRNMLATLILSRGTPMLLAGDEFGHTQRGNNNAYCQDSEISWLEWPEIGDEGHALAAFVRRLTFLRHAFPILRRGRFLTAQWNEELQVKDVTWINATGSEMGQEHWRDPHMRCFGMLLDGRGQESGIKRQAGDASLLLVMNSYTDVVKFTLPALVGGSRWLCMLDTNQPDRSDTPAFDVGQAYDVTARSFLLFAGLTVGSPGRAVQRIALEFAARAARD